MPIVQISKIIHRTGANVDLPQLDTGEFGFAVDERRLYIGNDPILHPASGGGTTQTELLTDSSPIRFSQITGSSNLELLTSNTASGQLLGLATQSGNVTIVNVGGNTGKTVDLGNVGNVKIEGGVNGYVLQTDGTGNLTWTTNGVLRYHVSSISTAEPAVITTTIPHILTTGSTVTITEVGGPGGTYFATGGYNGTNEYFVLVTGSSTFSIATDPDIANNLINGDTFLATTPNTGYITSTIGSGVAIPGGSNTQVQFNHSGAIDGSSKLTFNPVTGNLTLTGNLIVNTGNMSATKIVATSNGTGENYKVGDDAYIGDVNVVNTLQIKGVEDPANAYIIFGTGDTTKLGRDGTGPLSYGGDFSVTGNIIANSFSGDGGLLSNIAVGNIVGNVEYANIANTVSTNAQPNITSLGTLSDLSVDGNVTLNYMTGSLSLFANVDGLFATDGTTTYSIGLTPVV